MDEAMTEGTDHMDCARFEDIVHELDRPGTRGAELRDVALNHAESCESCGALLTETESLDFALLKLADESQRIATPARIEAGLLQEFRRTKAISSTRRVQRQIAAIGVAATLFLALGISLRHRAETSRTAGVSQVAASIPATRPVSGTSSATSTSTSGATDAGSGQQAQGQLHAVAGTTQAASASDGAEVAQDFTPLPYSDDLSMEEGGAVVRVILSRAALASFGVPITAADSSEQISADLLVSADGTPEAIRLVSQNVN
jgi:hypothetical protein